LELLQVPEAFDWLVERLHGDNWQRVLCLDLLKRSTPEVLISFIET
jgi:hypothetical protein